ncbi:TrkA family potassium uptake protein [Pseudenhygromyxa sp. WMMC2535]|uniref:potassium channel family protein n=1 Tax=Pseudenhygromyxa sp. WMMC2535 TaxID=2712867 RepID=UPI001553D73C|nr:TrkA family potassium uptake protein [Pseudenhygromyxa sp. WMMC2535]NVB36625.1 TrkA family potassium uptake protein [Pseudenhygromyxa sp. WMMC2535]
MYVLIAGGGALGREVAASLTARGHDVVVIDRLESVCATLYAELGVVAVKGNATDLHVLRDAGAGRADILVTALNVDADNIACALLGRSLGIERVIGRLRDASYEAAFRAAGVSHLIRATQLLRNQVVLHVEHPQVEEIVSVGDPHTHIVSVRVPAGAWCVGKSVAELAADRRFPEDCLLVGLRRQGETGIHIPRGGSCLRAGDEVLAIAAADRVDKVLAVLTRRG